MNQGQQKLLEDFNSMATHLKEMINGRVVVYVTNPGNWGDALIREGTERFFCAYGISYVKVRHADLQKRRVKLDSVIDATKQKHPILLYNGCGIYVPEYDVIDEIAALTHSFSQAVLLPSTYGVDMRKKAFSPNTTFFVRDRFQSQEFAPSATFCHDLAFFVQAPVLQDGNGTGHLMRTDKEAPSQIEIPKGNVDLSLKGRTHHDVHGFFKRISNYREIHTNRLHVGIAGLLLGKNVNLYEGNYFKIRSIYKSTIEGRFENVRFIRNDQ